MDDGGSRDRQRQARTLVTRRRLMEAGKRLFSQKGYHRTNSKEIAREAGVSTGSFYSYFGDKKRLFIEITRELTEKISGTIPELGATEAREIEPRDLVARIIQGVFKAHESSPEFHRELTLMLYTDPEVRALAEQWERDAVAAIGALLEHWQDRLAIKDTEAGALLLHDTIEAIVHKVKVYGATFEQKRLQDELTRMICSYLFCEPGSAE